MSNMKSKLSPRLGKPFIVKLLRSSYITKVVAQELHDYIRDKVMTELMKGKPVNLFGLVTLLPYKQSGRFYGCINQDVNDSNYRVKAVVSRTIKDYCRIQNNKPSNEDTKRSQD